MNAVYRALSDPTRRSILRLLRQRDMTAGELADKFPVTKPTMSKHFTVLKDADLIQGRRDGTSIIYTLNVSVLEEALSGLLTAFKIKPRSAEDPS
ncbi:MAG: autorepressor SdpR family transcription factor [Opitutales bacterium]